MSTRETAVAALADLLQGTGAEVWRNTDINRPVPVHGLIMLSEGDSSATAIMSPLMWEYELACEAAVTVTRDNEYARDTALDSLIATIGDLIVADRTLGGAVEYCDPSGLSFDAMELDGAGKTARITIVLSFVTSETILA